MPNAPVIDTLRLSPNRMKRIMGELDRAAAPGIVKKRSMRRWQMQPQKSICVIHENDATSKFYTIIPRDLSATGASFLFGAFLHPGVRCEFAARRVGGRSQALPGEVVRCRHIEGHVHEVAVKFDDPINPRDYFIDSGDAYLFNAEGIDPAKLAGDILLVCGNASDEKLVRDAMRATTVLLTHESSLDKALELVRDPGFDFAFVYHNLTPDGGEPEDGNTGLDLIQRVRAEGLLMPMVLINDAHDRDLRMAAIAAGAVEMLAKPIAWDALYQAAGEFLSEFTPDNETQLEADLASLSSAKSQGEVDGDPSALTETCFNLSKAVLKSEEEEVNNLLRVLELTAKGMRCDELAIAARETVQLLHRTQSCQSLQPRVRVMTRMSRTLSKVA